MSYDGAFIGESRQPAFDAARYLLAKGLALPSDKLTTYRDGKPCLFATVGRAAKLTVRENDKGGIGIVTFRPFEAALKKSKAIDRDHQVRNASISVVEQVAV
jgi:hypothetical protein